MASSRADGVASSPERVVVSLSGFRGQQHWSQAGGSQKFCVHEFWWAQGNPGAFRTHSAVFCIEVLLFGKRG